MPRELPERQPRQRPELVPKTQQVKGRDHEPGVLKSLGARQHSNSGAGWKKGDGSTEDELIELKLCKRTHSLAGDYIRGLHREAAKTGKTARLLVYFEDADVTLDCTIRLGR